MGFWPVVLNVLRNSDVVLLLVDARMPEISQNSEIVNKVERMRDKRLLIIFNKADLIGNEEIASLKRGYPGAFFISAVKRTGVKNLKAVLVNMAENWNRSSLRIGIVGYPNVGKSTLINLLVPTAKAKVSSVSGTTRKTQWVREGRLRIMDSPGVIPFGDKKAKVGMTASKDPHKIRNPENVAINVIEYLAEKGENILEKFYGIESGSSYEMFGAIGRKKGFLIKGGDVDENRTAIKIIDDWQKGKISLK
jgi:ribosome biogenesis GTPase A